MGSFSPVGGEIGVGRLLSVVGEIEEGQVFFGVEWRVIFGSYGLCVVVVVIGVFRRVG